MKEKLEFYWLIVLVTMTTSRSHVKHKNDMFTARGEDMKEGRILVFHLYLNYKNYFFCLVNCAILLIEPTVQWKPTGMEDDLLYDAPRDEVKSDFSRF